MTAWALSFNLPGEVGIHGTIVSRFRVSVGVFFLFARTLLWLGLV